MMTELSGRLAAVDLRISEATVLLLVGVGGEMTSSDIGKALDIKRANMVPLLNRLEAAKLICRRRLDRKSLAIGLTGEGRDRLKDVGRITQQFEADLLERIPAPHRPHFLPALHALIGQARNLGNTD